MRVCGYGLSDAFSIKLPRRGVPCDRAGLGGACEAVMWPHPEIGCPTPLGSVCSPQSPQLISGAFGSLSPG